MWSGRHINDASAFLTNSNNGTIICLIYQTVHNSIVITFVSKIQKKKMRSKRYTQKGIEIWVIFDHFLLNVYFDVTYFQLKYYSWLGVLTDLKLGRSAIILACPFACSRIFDSIFTGVTGRIVCWMIVMFTVAMMNSFLVHGCDVYAPWLASHFYALRGFWLISVHIPNSFVFLLILENGKPEIIFSRKYLFIR